MIASGDIVAFFHPCLQEIFTGTVVNIEKAKEKNIYKIDYYIGPIKMTAVVDSANVIKMGT